jgi:natural product precursor
MKATKKLALNRETIRELTESRLSHVVGGNHVTTTERCPNPPNSAGFTCKTTTQR